MRLRTTLIVLLLGLLAALAIWKLGPERNKTVTRTPLVAPELLDRWDEIELRLFSEEKIRLVREPGGGVFLHFGQEKPGAPDFHYRDPADLDHVEMLVNAIRTSFREPLQGDADDLLRMGLDPPRIYVKVKTGDRVVDLGFGIDDPAGGGVLAREAADKQVFRTAPSVRDLLKAANRDQWRSRTVFGYDVLGVTSIAITRFPAKEGAPPDVITVDREGGNLNWRIKEPRSLPADAQACSNLAQQLTVMKVQNFISQSWEPTIVKMTALPDTPLATITLASGPSALVLSIGSFIPSQGYAAYMEARSKDACFTLRKEDVDPILALTVDSLRPRRLFPRIEATLVGLTKASADDKTILWQFGRQGDSTRGKWEILQPFHALANDGKGSGSFAQAVVELDRIEVDEFLDPKTTPFEPQNVLRLKYRSEPITREDRFQVAIAGGRVLMRDPTRPDELFSVKGKVAEILALDPELHRDRLVFPRQAEFTPKLLRWRFEPNVGKPIEVYRPDLGSTPVAAEGTPVEQVAKLTAAAAALFGAPCEMYVHQKDVPGDPFVRPVFQLTLKTKESEETLVVGAEGADGFYCRLTPRLHGDVLMVVKREFLKELLELTR